VGVGGGFLGVGGCGGALVGCGGGGFFFFLVLGDFFGVVVGGGWGGFVFFFGGGGLCGGGVFFFGGVVVCLFLIPWFRLKRQGIKLALIDESANLLEDCSMQDFFSFSSYFFSSLLSQLLAYSLHCVALPHPAK